MPRLGLNSAQVVAYGAELADEAGIEAVSFATLAVRLGIKAPALYKHVDSISDLQHRIATLAMTEFGDLLREELQGKSGINAVNALFRSMQSYISKHPGRYSAVNGAQLKGDDDPLLYATTQVINSMRAVLSGYGIKPEELDHAIRMLRSMIHGYALLCAADAFHWSNDPEETVTWMINFFDTGLRAVANNTH